MPPHAVVKPRNFRLLGLVAVALLAAACSSSPSAHHTADTSTGHHNAKSHRSGASAQTDRSTRSSKSGTSGTSGSNGANSSHRAGVPFSSIHKPVGLFDSPNRNISCELDHHYKASPTGVPLNDVTCITLNPPRSVVLSAAGTLTECTGLGCTWNSVKGTPILQYGTATGAGAIRCDSAAQGMTCTVDGAKGFIISPAGVLPLGGAAVTSQQKTG